MANAKSSSEARMFHSSLRLLPMPVRFVLSGVSGNVFFMAFYNWAYASFQTIASASRIFSVVQFMCIVVNHALNMGIVFGWPENYVSSLMSNMPVGLVSLALGAFCMEKLEEASFDEKVNDWLGDAKSDNDDQKGGFYASLVVMLVTGIFNYVALNIVNSSPVGKKQDGKKEL
mmetsp:Transcript_39040/g.79610  ORF Transcript_39040/g.79610 Transcript_39040/m.79610 type:complete len:173 (-) Transcript_39040:187-705(-)